MNVQRIHLNIEPLRQLANIMRKYKYKHTNTRKPIPNKVMDQVLHEYTVYWIGVVRSAGVKFDSQRHMINMTKIQVSDDIDDIIRDILPMLLYVDYSPVIGKHLPPKTCEFDLKTVLKYKEKDKCKHQFILLGYL